MKNKKPITSTTISHVKPWSLVYSGEYIAIDYKVVQLTADSCKFHSISLDIVEG